MREIETIWHYILEQFLLGSFKHTQQDLAYKFQYSSSTVNHAVEISAGSVYAGYTAAKILLILRALRFLRVIILCLR